jgi:hypothetical protein
LIALGSLFVTLEPEDFSLKLKSLFINQDFGDTTVSFAKTTNGQESNYSVPDNGETAPFSVSKVNKIAYVILAQSIKKAETL